MKKLKEVICPIKNGPCFENRCAAFSVGWIISLFGKELKGKWKRPYCTLTKTAFEFEGE